MSQPPLPPQDPFGQPQYGQQYGQPDYGQQPQYGQPQYGQAQPPPPPKSRKGLWIGLGVGAVVLLLLCCGGGFAAYKLTESEAREALDPITGFSQSPSPKASKPSTTKPTITLTLPDKLGIRSRITDAEHAKFAKDTEAAMKADGKVESTVVGYYGTVDPKKDKVYLAGATTTVAMSKADFEATFSAMAKGAGLADMTGARDVNPGPMGGYAKCGLLKIEGMPVAACAWADEGSFVTVMWYNRQVSSQIRAELITIRGQVEQKT